MFSMSISTKKFHSWKCPPTVWRVIPLEIHFCWLSLRVVTQIIKGKQLYYKMWSSKSKIWESLTFMFFTAMLITFIKGGTPAQFVFERGSAMTRATFVIFWPKLSSFIDWCCYYTHVSYTGSCEPLVIILAHWNNSPRVDMLRRSDTLSRFRANQSLLFLLFAACLAEKQSIQI